MNKRKLVLQVIGTLLGLYLMVIYAIMPGQRPHLQLC